MSKNICCGTITAIKENSTNGLLKVTMFVQLYALSNIAVSMQVWSIVCCFYTQISADWCTGFHHALLKKCIFHWTFLTTQECEMKITGNCYPLHVMLLWNTSSQLTDPILAMKHLETHQKKTTKSEIFLDSDFKQLETFRTKTVSCIKNSLFVKNRKTELLGKCFCVFEMV